jgi:hypothetical protein
VPSKADIVIVVGCRLEAALDFCLPMSDSSLESRGLEDPGWDGD